MKVPATVAGRDCVVHVNGKTVHQPQSDHYDYSDDDHGWYQDDYSYDDQISLAPSQDYHFNGNATVRLRRSMQITFIQTDKPIYRPGQLGKSSMQNRVAKSFLKFSCV